MLCILAINFRVAVMALFMMCHVEGSRYISVADVLAKCLMELFAINSQSTSVP